MSRTPYIGATLFLSLSFSLATAQYISEVIEYTPAPGQFINTSPWGSPMSSASIVGDVNGTLCLGAFGGNVIFRFENPVENHPDNPYGVDFSIFGNPLEQWSEPGIVWVMKDDNENGQPDDTWFELAGSDYHFSSSKRNYVVTYTNPLEPIASNVPWIDNLGYNGFIPANSIHNQPYYPDPDSFPSIPNKWLTLKGSSILAGVDFSSDLGFISIKRSFGYADNQLRGSPPYTKPDNPYTEEIENSGGDAFDIDWAVDSAGEYVELDMIHFVKVQNGVSTFGGNLGELSTEVTGAVDVLADGSVTGEMEMIVIRDLPVEIETSTFQLEAFVFHGGRLQTDREVKWLSNMAGAYVDEDYLLTINESGNLVLTASLTGGTEVTATVSATIKLNQTSQGPPVETSGNVLLFPNPAGNFVRISGVREASVSVVDIAGKCCLHIDSYESSNIIDLSFLPVGIYVVQVAHQEGEDRFQLFKK